MTNLDLDRLDFAKGGGVVSVVTQDAQTGAVLMVAFADREALERTLATGEMHYRSRSRGLWHKGATSGNTQKVVSLHADCDGDTVLANVIPAGPACHTGATTCFDQRSAELAPSVSESASRSSSYPYPYSPASSGAGETVARLDEVIASRATADPKTSYTARLLGDRNLRLKKLGEEAAELAVACADGDRERAAAELADLVYHGLVALRAVGGSWEDVRAALEHRAK